MTDEERMAAIEMIGMMATALGISGLPIVSDLNEKSDTRLVMLRDTLREHMDVRSAG